MVQYILYMYVYTIYTIILWIPSEKVLNHIGFKTNG